MIKSSQGLGIFPTRIRYWLVTNESFLNFLNSVTKRKGADSWDTVLPYHVVYLILSLQKQSMTQLHISTPYTFLFQQPIITAYTCVCNVTNIKTSKETSWSSGRMRHSEVMKCWKLHSFLFALYFMMQFIIMWWDNIFTQVHSSFQIENE